MCAAGVRVNATAAAPTTTAGKTAASAMEELGEPMDAFGVEEAAQERAPIVTAHDEGDNGDYNRERH